MPLTHFIRLFLSIVLLAFASSAAYAQSDGFGDDASVWSNDGECDDPRFEGPGAATILVEEDRGHDATDCRTLYEAGEISLIAGESLDVADTPVAPVADTGPIDFGDDTSLFANDGECDDPRFVGEHMAIELIEADRGHDASDCQALFDEGLIRLKPAPTELVGDIDFGDDAGQWNNDGECDDPRFDGEGSAVNLGDDHLGHDATDCRELFLAGSVVYLGDDPAMEQVTADGIDFGDNTSEWAEDGECDDPRFEGEGMAESPSGAHLGHDATDCLTFYQEGSLTLIGSAELQNNDPATAGIDFGDDSGEWPNDGECDDPRFEGPGMAFHEYLSDANISRDASDCRMHYITGQVTVAGAVQRTTGQNIFDDIDFGDDSGTWPEDGECDDTRFQGAGMAAEEYLDGTNDYRDASDCLNLYQTDEVIFVGHPADTMVDTSGIDFGDDSGTWPDDGECEDPRFTGEGMANAGFVTDDAVGRDATDCRSLFERGRIQLADSQPEEFNGMLDGIDFGDNNGGWPNDGECDDPRFEGPGMATPSSLTTQNEGHDATDCMALYESGDVQLIAGKSAPAGTGDIDFGDDTGAWPNDNECDDMRFTGAGMAAASTLDEANIGHDATDCRSLFNAGQVQLAAGQTPLVDTSGIDFGNDSGQWPNDGECDDPRFKGPGMAFDDTLNDVNIMGDATDCREQYNAGNIQLM